MEKFVKEGYGTFSELISEGDFNQLINCLEEEEMKNFLRASLMYQRAIKCRSCDQDVCIALLCSAVEAISGGENIVFKDWLVNNRLMELINKSEGQLRRILNRAYQDYASSEENREGISYNFRKFLTTYCPEGLKNPPIKIYKGEGGLFDITLRAIYSNFRCLYLHEGIGYASTADQPLIDKETGEPIHLIAVPLLVKVGRKYVSIELTKITDWFAEVIKNSLFQCLISKK